MIADPNAAREQAKAALAASNQVSNLMMQSFDLAWYMGTRYHSKELAGLKTLKANVDNDSLSDQQFRDFARTVLNP